jgi:hypothetical protein
MVAAEVELMVAQMALRVVQAAAVKVAVELVELALLTKVLQVEQV